MWNGIRLPSQRDWKCRIGTLTCPTIRVGTADPWLGYRGNPYGHAFGGFGAICGGFNCSGYMQLGQFGNLAGQFGLAGSFGNIAGFGAQFGFQGGIRGFGGLGGGIGGGGFGAGGLQVGGGQFGLQGSFSHFAPGGQFGMSFGHNRDFGAQGRSGAGPLPALGIGTEMVRRDFADSAFWSAKVRTDATGKATTTFKLPDSLTNWRVQVTAVSSQMHVGSSARRSRAGGPSPSGRCSADVHRGRHGSRLRHGSQPHRQESRRSSST